MPATNDTSERSFSALRRIKTYLHSTMGQSRLHNLMLLRVHKEATGNLDLIACANDFVGDNSHRYVYYLFGKFVRHFMHFTPLLPYIDLILVMFQ